MEVLIFFLNIFSIIDFSHLFDIKAFLSSGCQGKRTNTFRHSQRNIENSRHKTTFHTTWTTQLRRVKLLITLSLEGFLNPFCVSILLCVENGVTRSITLNLNQTTQLVLPSTDNEISSPKLSEPRHLFSLQRELGPQQAPRWPAECQVKLKCHNNFLHCTVTGTMLNSFNLFHVDGHNSVKPLSTDSFHLNFTEIPFPDTFFSIWFKYIFRIPTSFSVV